jgi:hypothetical protein
LHLQLTGFDPTSLNTVIPDDQIAGSLSMHARDPVHDKFASEGKMKPALNHTIQVAGVALTDEGGNCLF